MTKSRSETRWVDARCILGLCLMIVLRTEGFTNPGTFGGARWASTTLMPHERADMQTHRRRTGNQLFVRPSIPPISSYTSTSSFNETFIEYSSMGARRVVVWDEASSSFNQRSQTKLNVQQVLHKCFFPSETLTADYYRYTVWRAAQRLVAATNSVFGTQALLLALGFKRNKIGLAAATTWVLKDCLGKVSRIIWASRNGGKFDGDAKKWRFRASLLFAAGNALEIVTYLLPSLFLITAAAANAMKQMALVTSSATRNTIYKSFDRNADNIGDITAKGEAQIAVIDLLGLLLGIRISKATDLSKVKIVTVFVLLSIVDLLCVFNEIKSVVFRQLNFERCGYVLQDLFQIIDRAATQTTPTELDSSALAGIPSELDSALTTSVSKNTETLSKSWAQRIVGRFRKSPAVASTVSNPSVEEPYSPGPVAKIEQLLLPARHGGGMIKSWSTIGTNDAQVIRQSLDLFGGRSERFAVIAVARPVSSWLDAFSVKRGLSCGAEVRRVKGIPVVLEPEVLLHKNATSKDIFRAMIVVNRLSYNFGMLSEPISVANAAAPLQRLPLSSDTLEQSSMSTTEQQMLDGIGLGKDALFDMVTAAYSYETENLASITDHLQAAGWITDRFMFGNIKHRVEW
ncbi:vitamin B6 photo-protection and homoeostasis-domain-containing protein [Ochromonadaceae sp. CCMP2298]|nr:vitamin B6 photo-protection and homoeostasis-domain-containing protein [Ochromonadaceae sp. CCMP2298]